MLTCARLPENSGSFDDTRPRGRQYGKIGEAESSFLLGEAILEIVCGRFAWSAVLESSLNGQELGNYGLAKVVQVAVPGEVALNAANRYFSVDEKLAQGEVPNLVDHVLQVWCFGLAHPEFDCGTLKVDCGMVFHEAVPPSWIIQIDTLSA